MGTWENLVAFLFPFILLFTFIFFTILYPFEFLRKKPKKQDILMLS